MVVAPIPLYRLKDSVHSFEDLVGYSPTGTKKDQIGGI
jgi:hypothetical protein